MPKIPIWGWIAIAVGAFLLLRPRVALGQGVRFGGRLDQVDMGTHAIIKVPGGSVLALVGMTGLTKNSAGVGIAWLYSVRLVIQQGSTFSWEVTSGVLDIPFNTSQLFTLSFRVPIGAPPGPYSATAFLRAAVSDATGTPTGGFTDIPGASLTHPNAINMGVGPIGPAALEGAINNVEVAQALVAAAQGFLQ